MLRYLAVNEANQVQRRLKRDTYDRPWCNNAPPEA